MEHGDELDELEVSESDVALLRELLEESETEEDMDTEEDCVMQVAMDGETEANVDINAEQRPEYSCDIFDSGWIEMAEAGSWARRSDDVADSDWYEGENAVGVVGFECWNGGVDYSYMYNEMSYGCLWEV